MIDQTHASLVAELPRLLVFAEVARRRSFAAAAQSLGLSRSTVSHHVGALEDALGVRLLERTTRAVRTNEQGSRLLEAAEAILAEWAGAREALTEEQDEPRGTLVVTAPDMVAERLVVPAIDELIDRHPRCNVDLRITARNVDLIREDVDVAVRAGPLPDSSRGARLLTTTDHVVVGSPGAVERWPVHTPADLHAVPWLEHGLRRKYRIVERDGETAELPGTHRVLADTASILVSLALAGTGFALLPELFVREELRRGDLVTVCEGWRATPPLTLHAVIPSPRRQSGKVRRFVEMLLARFA